jgi:hypothetical protein
MSIIEKIARGADNFKSVEIPKLNISVGLVILPRLTEIEMIARAQAWCKQQTPAIEDPDLIKVQEDAFLLWKALVDPDRPWKEVTGGRVPNVLYSSMDDMERALPGDWQDWLSEQLLQFRQDVSPFTTAKSFQAIETILEKIRTESELTESFLEAFKIVYCAEKGMLPTERRVREMTRDQWWLLYYSLPDESKAHYLKSPLIQKAK